MTRLASISNNHLSVTCDQCNHTALLPVTSLIGVFGREASVPHVVKRARCSECGATIQAKLTEGISPTEIARDMGISRGTVYKAKALM